MEQLKYAPAFCYAKGVDQRTRSVTAIVSDETIDRMGDVVDSASWQLSDFLRNPVVLHQHNHARPVGRAESVGVVGKSLQATIVFAKTPAGDEMLQLYADGALRAFSVGFSVGRIASEVVDGRQVDRLLNCSLREISCVAVPANPSALVRAKALGLVPQDYQTAAVDHRDYSGELSDAALKAADADGDDAGRAALDAVFPQHDTDARERASTARDTEESDHDYSGDIAELARKAADAPDADTQEVA